MDVMIVERHIVEKMKAKKVPLTITLTIL